MTRSYKQLRTAIERLGTYPEDENGLIFRRLKDGEDEDGNKYLIERHADAPDDVVKDYRRRVTAGDMSRVVAAMTLADYCSWCYELPALWQVDSIVRMVEEGIEPRRGSELKVLKGLPAVILETERQTNE